MELIEKCGGVARHAGRKRPIDRETLFRPKQNPSMHDIVGNRPLGRGIDPRQMPSCEDK